ncbi:MAG TPA: RecX family transcriptional regulator [bacterium]|nr:RecX family transcriptional regulator [bacterium]
MKISEILKKSPKKYIVKFSNDYFIEVDKKTLADKNLVENLELTESEFLELKRQLESINAEKIILNKLSARKRSEFEIRSFLKNADISAEIIEQTIDKYKKLKQINDYDFAESFINDKLHLSKKSLKTIKSELQKFKISNDIINELFAKQKNADTNIELENCKKLIQKRLKLKKITDLEKHKITRYLLFKGYNFNTISQAFSEISDANLANECHMPI